MNCGPSHWNAKLDADKAAMIRAAEGRTAEIAARFGIGPRHVRRVRQGIVWKRP